MNIWKDKEEFDCWIDYKLTSNKNVLSFSSEVFDLLKQVQEHVYKVELSKSELRYILTVRINPKACRPKGKIYETEILGKTVDISYLEPLTHIEDKGYYLKTLGMKRVESIDTAIKLLKEVGLSGYVFNEEILTRYKDDEASKELEKFMDNL